MRKFLTLAVMLVMVAGIANAQSKWVFGGATSKDDGKLAFEVGFSVPKIAGISSVGHAAIGDFAKLNWEVAKWLDVDFFGVVDQAYILLGPGVDYTAIDPNAGPQAYFELGGGFGLSKVIHTFKDKSGKLGFDPRLAVFAGVKTHTPLPGDDKTFRFSFHGGLAIQVGK